jgi:hypothetical protein
MRVQHMHHRACGCGYAGARERRPAASARALWVATILPRSPTSGIPQCAAAQTVVQPVTLAVTSASERALIRSKVTLGGTLLRAGAAWGDRRGRLPGDVVARKAGAERVGGDDLQHVQADLWPVWYRSVLLGPGDTGPDVGHLARFAAVVDGDAVFCGDLNYLSVV